MFSGRDLSLHYLTANIPGNGPLASSKLAHSYSVCIMSIKVMVKRSSQVTMGKRSSQVDEATIKMKSSCLDEDTGPAVAYL